MYDGKKRCIITDELGIRVSLLLFSLVISKNMNFPISGLVLTENFSGLVVPSDDTLYGLISVIKSQNSFACPVPNVFFTIGLAGCRLVAVLT